METTQHLADSIRPGALANLRVLDFTQSLAGPYCTQILADLGAEVLKVEPVGVGDATRALGPFHVSDTEKRHSGYFHSINRNKKSIAVDLRSDAGRELVFDLISSYDIVVENFRVGAMDSLGLSYEELSACNDKLIYAAIRGFGDPRSGKSPYSKWPAFDVVAQAMGGITAVTGADKSHPVKVGPGVGDLVPGLFLAIGVLAALAHRHATGEGQFVDVGMVDSILSISERTVYQHSFGDVVAEPTGNHQPFMGPFGLYPASDGHVAIAATSQNFFEAMCNAIDAADLLKDERFCNVQGRKEYLRDLIDEVSRRTVRFTKAELHSRLGGIIPFGPAYNMADIAEDPHFKARDMLPKIDLDGVESRLAIAGQPIKFSRTPSNVRHAGPDLGADTREVLRAMGRSDQEIAALFEQGSIG